MEMLCRLLTVVIAVCGLSPALAQEADLDRPLRVAVAECPPFVMHRQGGYSGLAIYLWEQVGTELGLEWEYAEYPLGDMLTRISSPGAGHSIDVGISCISVTAEREKIIDFSHSFTETHTAIAIRQEGLGAVVIGFFTSPAVWKALLILLAVAALIGLVFYALEHKNNKKLFSTTSGWGQSIETMIIGLLFATNGPIRFYRFKTLTARVLATLLALSGTVLIAAVTAVLASSFTLNSLQSQVRGLDDLRSLAVGALEASTSSRFLESQGIEHQTRPDLDGLIRDLDEGALDAIVSDAAFLQYRIRKGQEQGRLKSLSVLPVELEEQNYAFALNPGTDRARREVINRALLTVRKERDWRDRVKRYLGQ